MLFMIYGTFMCRQPGHGNLAGGRFLEDVRTAPRYRLFLVDGWPALAQADALDATGGVTIAAELYELSEEHVARLAGLEPAGWSRAAVELEDGRRAEAFLADPELVARGEDISAHGGWAAFVASRVRT
jgi:allophanate hydrolase